jgi:DNA-directed RNA polymerase specialized sigma subunit
VVELDDLVQAGWLAILRARRRRDPARCLEFEPYAQRWIEGAVTDCLVDGCVIRPRHREASGTDAIYFDRRRVARLGDLDLPPMSDDD